MPEWQDWLIGIPVLITLVVILLVEWTGGSGERGE